jgi:L-fuculose-phosphate aldolase
MDAYFKTEIIDAYCRILILAKQLGRVNYYSDEKAAELIKLKPSLGIRDVRLERGLENCDLCGNSLFREGYSDFQPEPRAFVPEKLQKHIEQAAAATTAAGKLAEPSSNGHATGDMEALVKAITDQVMQAMNGAVK